MKALWIIQKFNYKNRKWESYSLTTNTKYNTRYITAFETRKEARKILTHIRAEIPQLLWSNYRAFPAYINVYNS